MNCNVEVTALEVEGVERRIFESFRMSVFEFMNNTRWTTDVFLPDERIECSILINVTERISNDQFKATISIQSRRPVYKTAYNTAMLNHIDNEFQFRYLEYQPFEYSPTAHTSNLTAVLAYYAYLIIALDYDSYAPNGGTAYFQQAQTIVNNAQNVVEPGWKAFESDRNRFWIIENILSQTFAPLRTAMYNYHIKGLDVMMNDMDGARTEILAALESLKTIHRIKPMSFNIQMFFNAKADELVHIFSKAYPDVKARAVQLLNELDPGHTAKYQKILENN